MWRLKSVPCAEVTSDSVYSKLMLAVESFCRHMHMHEWHKVQIISLMRMDEEAHASSLTCAVKVELLPEFPKYCINPLCLAVKCCILGIY